MRLVDGSRLYSASDLLLHLGCQYATVLNLKDLENPSGKAEDDAHARLVQEKGLEHERKHLDRFRVLYGDCVAEIGERQSLEARIAATLRAIGEGPQVIYQAALREDPWHGFADFLIRVDEKADLWAYCYEPLDTKLAHSSSAGHVAQLCVYAELLAGLRGRQPCNIHLALGDDRETAHP